MKLAGPLKLAAGTKYTVAALPEAATVPFSTIAVVRPASLYSVPFNGRLVMRNDATVPSMSEPDSETAIEAAFSSPEPSPHWSPARR